MGWNTWCLITIVLLEGNINALSNLRNQITPEEECINSSPRVFSKTLAVSLCQNASSYFIASGAAECAHAVGRAALNPKLTVELCAANGHNAGLAGGKCATAAQKELQSFDQLPPPMRISLCIGAASYAPKAPVSCSIAAGKLARNQGKIGKAVEWLNDMNHRIALCNGASSTAPVECLESFYSKHHQQQYDKSLLRESSLKLCSKVVSSAQGQCASYILDLSSTILKPTQQQRNIFELIHQACSNVPFPQYAEGPALCLKEAPSAWSFEQKVKLCANAYDNGPAMCAKVARGTTAHSLSEYNILKLCSTPKLSLTSRQLIRKYFKLNQRLNEPLPLQFIDEVTQYQTLLPSAGLCANQSPLQMLPDDIILLCDPHAQFQRHIEMPLPSAASSLVGPALCAKFALSLRLTSDKAKVCRGAHDKGPAECVSAAPYTMTSDLKVKLCHGATSAEPGKCASRVRDHILSTTLLPTLTPSSSKPSKYDDETNIEQGEEALISTVPEAPSEAAAAGMLGSDPRDPTKADVLAVELCHRTQSVGPAQCFAAAPLVLDESSQRGHDLRTSLCVDAEDELPAKCAVSAYNHSNIRRNIQHLGAGVVVSLCHGINERDVVHTKQIADEFGKDDEIKFGPISCVAYMLKTGGVFNWWSSSTLPELVLRLCTHAEDEGPAVCAANAPARFTANERVELCRLQNDSTHNEHQNQHSRDWLASASCASAAPIDIPHHKIVAACAGASSDTPAHCLRASPGSLTSEDVANCRAAIARPQEVHVQVFEEVVGQGDAVEARLRNSNPSDDDSVIENLSEVSEEQSVQSNSDKGDDLSEGPKVGSDDGISSTLRVETVVLDQFLQPVQVSNQDSFQVTTWSSLSNGKVDNDEDEIMVDLDSSSGSSHLRFELNNHQRSISMNNEDQSKQSNHEQSSSSSQSSHKTDFSKMISFALNGDILGSMKVLFSSNNEGEANRDKVRGPTYQVGEDFASGVVIGLQHDWLKEGFPTIASTASSFTSLPEMDVTQAGQFAGAIVALPFRTGQGLGYSFRHQISSSRIFNDFVDKGKSIGKGSNSEPNKGIDDAKGALSLNDEFNHKNNENEVENGNTAFSSYGQMFDIMIGLIVALLSWGSIVYYTIQKLSIVKGGSSFGRGDFGDEPPLSSQQRKQSYWRGKDHTLKERNERANNARQARLETKLEKATVHDANYGLIGASGGIAKRKKKFVLGAS